MRFLRPDFVVIEVPQHPLIPAQAGIQGRIPRAIGLLPWVPAFAGTSGETNPDSNGSKPGLRAAKRFERGDTNRKRGMRERLPEFVQHLGGGPPAGGAQAFDQGASELHVGVAVGAAYR